LQTHRFLTLEEVILIHQDQIISFGGSNGIRDQGLLESALAQPQVTFGGQFLHPNIHQQAAAYLYHLVMNHPFIDGNKRTAFAVMDTFLKINNYCLNLSNQDAYNLVMKVANHQISKENLIDYLDINIKAI
jgi:death on curing protein